MKSLLFFVLGILAGILLYIIYRQINPYKLSFNNIIKKNGNIVSEKTTVYEINKDQKFDNVINVN